MNTRRENYTLQPNRPGYPWQIVEGDGVTWVILRQKKKLQGKEIQLLGDVFLDGFTWSSAESNGEKHFYQGNVAVSVCYAAQEATEEDPAWVDIAAEEEHCRELFLSDTKSKTTKNPSEHKRELTSFPSLLLNEIKAGTKRPEGEQEVWKLNMPWQAWLAGKEPARDPVIQKVHLAQVGLSSLLLEVLIKLEAREPLVLVDNKNCKYLLAKKKEMVYQLGEEEIKEVIGIAQNRAFFTGTADLFGRNLHVSNSLKTTLVFISAFAGGERILTASHISNEEHCFTGMQNLDLAPAGYRQYTHSAKTSPIDETRVLCSYETLWGLVQQYDAGWEKSRPTASAVKSSVLAEAVASPARKRPGERWRKERGADQRKKEREKLVISIKI